MNERIVEMALAPSGVTDEILNLPETSVVRWPDTGISLGAKRTTVGCLKCARRGEVLFRSG
jgi:hypothetical protein